jgi:CDGSH-type Zn-finger protein
MSDPACPQKSPYGVTLDAGTYWWCACGRSSKQPFCDGSHKGSEFAPVQYKLEQPKTVHLCGCKRTSNRPLCDGTHSRI